jgi:hypothetical protein
MTEPAAVPPVPKRKRRRWPVLVAALVLVPLLLGGIYTAFVLTWAYSDGDRAGVLQKFSRKGWLCKTYEGELALYVVGGVAPQIWYFTVREEDVAEQLNATVGQKVQVHYTEHRGVPSSCFGETPYFVDQVKALPEGT